MIEMEKQYHDIDAHVSDDGKVVEDWSFKKVFDTAKEAVVNTWTAVKDTGKKVKKWTTDNPEMAALLVPVFGAALVGGINHMTLTEADKKDRYRQDHEFYDPGVDVTFDSTRPLSTTEKRYFAQRRRSGDPVDEILSDLGVLKGDNKK